MNRRAFTGMLVAGAESPLLHGVTTAKHARKGAKCCADWPCWPAVIAWLQLKGVQVIAVRNPLMTLQEVAHPTRFERVTFAFGG